MNSIFARPFLFLTVLLITFSAQAQYLVTTRNDTIRGDLKMLTFGQVDQIVTEVNNKKKVYKAMEVKSLLLDGELYKPMSYENSIHFFKLLKSGYLSYYAFRPANQITYSGFYLAKLDGRGIEVPGLAFKKVMSNFLQDCPQVVEKIKAEELKRNDLQQIIDAYNACIESKTTSAYVSTEKVPVDNEKLRALRNLQLKVNSQENLSNKKDITDLLSDLSDKVGKQQTVPNYQIEALKGYLTGNDQTRDELEKVIAVLTKN
jgi:hypothetical protein